MIPLLPISVCVVLLAGAALSDMPYSTNAADYNAGVLGRAPNQTFRSSSVRAPVFQVNRLDHDALDPAPYLFIDWLYNHTFTPMILRSDDLSLVYAGQSANHVRNVRAQAIDNKQYLTFWEGTPGIGVAGGHALVLDETYRPKYNITAVGLPGSVITDLHELELTDEGTVIVSIFQGIPYNLTFRGGDANGVLLDSLFQEIDPETDEAIFTWRASEYWRPEDSIKAMPIDELIDAFDFYHINSIAKVSLRFCTPLRLRKEMWSHPVSHKLFAGW